MEEGATEDGVTDDLDDGAEDKPTDGEFPGPMRLVAVMVMEVMMTKRSLMTNSLMMAVMVMVVMMVVLVM